jgi:intracellular sulfur oxidation DsrE/DsrF family protein
MIRRQKYLIYISLLLLIFVSPASGTINPEDKSDPKVLVYQVKTLGGMTSSLESLKVALDNIGGHITNFEGEKPDRISVIIHGDNIKCLDKGHIDDELQFMVQWFLQKGVDLRVCASCLDELQLSLSSLVQGFRLNQ